MNAYLSKKIAIPDGIMPRCIAWSMTEGFVALGGDKGLLKVLKIDPGSAGVNLTMNQSLAGHQEGVRVVRWNDQYQKLTSSDESGMIIVWMFHDGQWYEEMINNRNKSTVRDMRWSADGLKICIAYADAAVIVGSVDGKRLWGKDLSLPNLALVEWSPDSRLILFCTETECHLYDASGNAIQQVPLAVLQGRPNARIVAVEWYAGTRGYPEEGCACLAVGISTGHVQLMSGHRDPSPIELDTGLRLQHLRWSPTGDVLLVAGGLKAPGMSPASLEGGALVVEFFSHDGTHLRSLKLPGSSLSSVSWEGTGLRLAAAVDAFVYFATVRPDHRWGALADGTVAFAARPDRGPAQVVFWDPRSGDAVVKPAPRLSLLRAAGAAAVLVSRGEAGGSVASLCDSIGTPLAEHALSVDLRAAAMTEAFFAAASHDAVFVWRLPPAARPGAPPAPSRRSEWIFSVDAGSTSDNWALDRFTPAGTADPATCVALSATHLFVGRASGGVAVYQLSDMRLLGRLALPASPARLAANCDGTRLAAVLDHGALCVQRLELGVAGCAATDLGVERRDVWDVAWAEDDPLSLAVMEKARLVVMRDGEAEEPVPCSSYIARFEGLTVTVVDVDRLCSGEGADPQPAWVQRVETRPLQQARSLLAQGTRDDLLEFMRKAGHPRLWRVVAETALERLDLDLADRAFVQGRDWHGIQLVKRLRGLGEAWKQRAEALAFLERFDEAEALLVEMDRVDLALDLRVRLGDWFHVAKFLDSGFGDDALRTRAFNGLGEHYAERGAWRQAVRYFVMAKNSAQSLECFHRLDDLKGLESLIDALTEGDPLLLTLGDKLAAAGVCDAAVTAFLKAGQVKRAIDCCIALHEWDIAVDLAQEHDYGQAAQVLVRHASQLRARQQTFRAVDLYRRALEHLEAAKLLLEVAREAGERGAPPLRMKKLHVLAALEVEAFKRRSLAAEVGGAAAGVTSRATRLATRAGQTMVGAGARGGNATQQTLAGLMKADASEMAVREVGSAWDGALAWHFWLMALRGIYEGDFEGGMRAAIHLVKFESALGAREVHSVLALTSFYAGYMGECSRAFTRLQLMGGGKGAEAEALTELAFAIFTQHQPRDPTDEAERLRAAEIRSGVCVSSGHLLGTRSAVKCRTCGHSSLSEYVLGHVACPLCHAPLQASGGPVGGGGDQGGLMAIAPGPAYGR